MILQDLCNHLKVRALTNRLLLIPSAAFHVSMLQTWEGRLPVPWFNAEGVSSRGQSCSFVNRLRLAVAILDFQNIRDFQRLRAHTLAYCRLPIFTWRKAVDKKCKGWPATEKGAMQRKSQERDKLNWRQTSSIMKSKVTGDRVGGTFFALNLLHGT